MLVSLWTATAWSLSNWLHHSFTTIGMALGLKLMTAAVAQAVLEVRTLGGAKT